LEDIRRCPSVATEMMSAFSPPAMRVETVLPKVAQSPEAMPFAFSVMSGFSLWNSSKSAWKVSCCVASPM
jgi:hypothetical protein